VIICTQQIELFIHTNGGAMDEKEWLKITKEIMKTYKKLEKLPAGSLQPHKRNEVVYYYLAYREASSVKRKYIGRKGDPEVQEMKRKIERRKRLEQYLRELKAMNEKHIKEEEKKMKRLRTYAEKMRDTENEKGDGKGEEG